MKTDLLLIDNKDSRRSQTVRFLEQGGWNVRQSADVLGAHRMAQECNPSVVMIIHTSPRRDGLKACRDIRTDCRTASIPILIVSELSEVADRLQGFRAGADDYIAIPCDFEELFVRIKALLLRGGLINALPSTTPWEGQLLVA